MKIKKYNIINLTAVAVIIGIISLFIIISCEKELPVPAAPAERELVGIVQDAQTGARLANAFVSIKPEGTDVVFNTVTDAAGSFKIITPVYPQNTNYYVYVSANGYLPESKIVQCNCDVLEVGLVLMSKPGCGIEFFPSNVIDYDTVNVGISSTKVVWLKVPSTSTQVTVDSLRIDNSNYNINFQFNLPVTIMPGDSLPITVTFSPNSQGNHNDSILVFTNCLGPTSRIPLILLGEAITADCGLQVSPSTFDFGNIGVGDTIRRTFTLTNPYQIPVVVDSVRFIPSSENVSVDPNFLLGLPVTVTNGVPINFDIIITARNAESINGSIEVYSSTCENNKSYTSDLRGRIFNRLCEIRPDSISIGRQPGPIRLSFGFPTYTFSIRNLSSTLPLTVEYLRVPNELYFEVTPAAPITINPLDSVLVTIRYSKIFVGTLQDTLIVGTNGSCGASVPIFAQYQNVGYQGASLFRWSNVPNLSNPDAIFKGFSFSDSTVVTDSISICAFDTSFAQPNTSADLRFDGIIYVGFGERYARLRAINGMKYLGNAQDEVLEFVKSNWQPRITDPNGDWSNLNGCSETIQDGLFKRGDVIAIKERDNTIALVMIQTVDTTIVEGYEFLYFLYITL